MHENYQFGQRRESRDDNDAMLSVQPPNLLSDAPFGYALNPFHQPHFQPDLPPEPMPEPAPGHSLLSDSDQRSLDALFKRIEYNTPQPAVEEGLNFTQDWILPPQYVGSTTSFGVQPMAPDESLANGFAEQFGAHAPSASSMMPPPPLPHPHSHSHPHPHASAEQQPSADVLAAAHLLQNGPMSQLFGMDHGQFTLPPQDAHMGQFQQPIPTRPAWPNHHSPHQAHMSAAHVEDEVDKTFVNMFSGQQGSRPARPRVVQPIKWGSDENFARGKFTPQNPKETSEAMEQERLLYMECLEPNKSAANTRPSSPAHDALTSPLRLKTRDPLLQARDGMDGPAAKRRKSKPKEDGDMDTPTSASVDRRKSKADVRFNPYSSASPPAPGNGQAGSSRRRKSTAKGSGGSKAPRENLTEDQKRENHIRSEQKRREVIKKGFEDLCDLVPEAKGGQFSKSAILVMTAEWLEQMLQGNDMLRAQARSMGLDTTAPPKPSTDGVLGQDAGN